MAKKEKEVKKDAPKVAEVPKETPKATEEKVEVPKDAPIPKRVWNKEDLEKLMKRLPNGDYWYIITRMEDVGKEFLDKTEKEISAKFYELKG